MLYRFHEASRRLPVPVAGLSEAWARLLNDPCSSAGDPRLPASLSMTGGPIDARKSPTRVKCLAWPGAGRLAIRRQSVWVRILRWLYETPDPRRTRFPPCLYPWA